MKERPIYVIGHKNPDTDAILAAVTYARLKRELGINAVAGRLGGIGPETEYLLKRFGFEEPVKLFSAKCLLKEIELETPCIASEEITIKEAIDHIVNGHRSVVVTDQNNVLSGLVTLTDVTSLWTSSEEEMKHMLATVKLKQIVKTLQAKVLYEADSFTPSGILDFYPTYASKIKDNSIVVVNNSPEIQRYCLNGKIALLVIVGEDWIDDVTLAQAKKNGVSVIATNLPPLNVSQLIFQAPSVVNIMTKREKLVTFSSHDTVDEAGEQMTKTRFHGYPVLDRNGRVIGQIDRYHLMNYEKNRYILVDHNEMSQTIDDISSGEIVEIVDHHRFGGLETISPISITTMIVGATCTIVALKFKENHIKIDKNLAGLLLSGIIADTMCFKSPTTTQIDLDMVKELEEISGEKVDDIWQGFIGSAQSILTKDNIEIVYTDFKEFDIKGLKVGISQTNCKTRDEYNQIKDNLQNYIDEVCADKNYALLLVMCTIPTGEGSYLLMSGPKKNVIMNAFADSTDENGFVAELVSRKKQVLPTIISALENK